MGDSSACFGQGSCARCCILQAAVDHPPQSSWAGPLREQTRGRPLNVLQCGHSRAVALLERRHQTSARRATLVCKVHGRRPMKRSAPAHKSAALPMQLHLIPHKKCPSAHQPENRADTSGASTSCRRCRKSLQTQKEQLATCCASTHAVHQNMDEWTRAELAHSEMGPARQKSCAPSEKL